MKNGTGLCYVHDSTEKQGSPAQFQLNTKSTTVMEDVVSQIQFQSTLTVCLSIMKEHGLSFFWIKSRTFLL